VDTILLLAELQKRGSLEQIGGHAYVADLTSCVALARRTASRISRLRNLAERRRLASLGEKLQALAIDPTISVEEIRAWLLDSIDETEVFGGSKEPRSAELLGSLKGSAIV
jgi:replicative DNA helicase